MLPITQLRRLGGGDRHHHAVVHHEDAAAVGRVTPDEIRLPQHPEPASQRCCPERQMEWKVQSQMLANPQQMLGLQWQLLLLTGPEQTLGTTKSELH